MSERHRQSRNPRERELSNVPDNRAEQERLYMPAMPPLGIFIWSQRQIRRLLKRDGRR